MRRSRKSKQRLKDEKRLKRSKGAWAKKGIFVIALMLIVAFLWIVASQRGFTRGLSAFKDSFLSLPQKTFRLFKGGGSVSDVEGPLGGETDQGTNGEEDGTDNGEEGGEDEGEKEELSAKFNCSQVGKHTVCTQEILPNTEGEFTPLTQNEDWVYDWRMLKPDGEIEKSFDHSPNTFSYEFESKGEYKVSLTVTGNGKELFSRKTVEVAPEIDKEEIEVASTVWNEIITKHYIEGPDKYLSALLKGAAQEWGHSPELLAGILSYVSLSEGRTKMEGNGPGNLTDLSAAELNTKWKLKTTEMEAAHGPLGGDIGTDYVGPMRVHKFVKNWVSGIGEVQCPSDEWKTCRQDINGVVDGDDLARRQGRGAEVAANINISAKYLRELAEGWQKVVGTSVPPKLLLTFYESGKKGSCGIGGEKMIVNPVKPPDMADKLDKKPFVGNAVADKSTIYRKLKEENCFDSHTYTFVEKVLRWKQVFEQCADCDFSQEEG